MIDVYEVRVRVKVRVLLHTKDQEVSWKEDTAIMIDFFNVPTC
jgi:hypothetical protein